MDPLKITFVDDPDPGHHSVNWIRDGLGVEEKGNIVAKAHLGICGRTHEIAFIKGDNLSWMIIADLYISKDNVCEEGTRCLNLDCDLNRTTRKSLSESSTAWKPLKLNRFRNLVSIVRGWNRDERVKKLLADFEGYGMFAAPMEPMFILRKS
jgi:hypothetical protein